MTVPTPTVLLPKAGVAEWNVIDPSTAPGLFAYRQMQALTLLDLPDLGSGDLDEGQRREALRSFVSLKEPLSALALFLGVVALEDFVRDLVTRLVDNPSCLEYFPDLVHLRAERIDRSPAQMFKRLDTDPAGVLDPEKINELFGRAMGITPIPTQEYWHLRDLALLRHTVAHHAALIREVDIPRFGYFIVRAGESINPPYQFVRDELMYVLGIGHAIERAVRSALFSKVIAATGGDWWKYPPREIVELVELFGYFGYVEPAFVPLGYSEPDPTPLEKCIADLKAEHGG